MSDQTINRDQPVSRWETFERVSKTLSILAIPVVLAFGGWLIQERLQDQAVSRDYVQLAVSILKEPKTSNVDPQMRTWAVQLLNDNSPTKFNAQVFEQLKSGTAQLPESFNVTQAAPPVASTSGNPRAEAANAELKGFDFLVSKDFEAAIQAFATAEKLWPSYHNVAEIRKLLEDNRANLAAAPREGKSEAWSNVYRTLTSKYSWGMPADVKDKLTAQL
ncbi:MAG: hypothetical protein QOF72_1603 [Blastocatellia bacterium]|jgi:hypothetical protein|nr:hypothetical protein [Blastocatellia bacterium]MDX6574486.1 hypothetical protein [Blastocatellia bacterium]